jgi:hypothetical protein
MLASIYPILQFSDCDCGNRYIIWISRSNMTDRRRRFPVYYVDAGICI